MEGGREGERERESKGGRKRGRMGVIKVEKEKLT